MENFQVIPMTYFNFILSLLIVFYSVYYFLVGKRLDKPVMLTNLISGLWSIVSIGLILYDRLIEDIFSEHTTRWLISITLFTLLGTKLGNILRIGKRNGG
jgi:hypothetical protein